MQEKIRFAYQEQAVKEVEQTIRLECLKLAMAGRAGHSSSDVIAAADAFYGYVTKFAVPE